MSTSTAPAPLKETRLQKFENFLKDIATFIPEHLPAIVTSLEAAIKTVKSSKSVAADIEAAGSAAASIVSIADPSAEPAAQAADTALNIAVSGEQAIAGAVGAPASTAPASATSAS